MYEEYKVERGRADHWAKYDAPESIDVVKEPIDSNHWNHWNGWGGGNFVGEDGKVAVDAKPKTVQQIVDNIQIRLNAPFYLWPNERDESRDSLYRMCGELDKADPQASRLMTLWYLLASGERSAAVDWMKQAQSAGVSSTIGQEEPPAVDGFYRALGRYRLIDGGGRGFGGGGGGRGFGGGGRPQSQWFISVDRSGGLQGSLFGNSMDVSGRFSTENLSLLGSRLDQVSDFFLPLNSQIASSREAVQQTLEVGGGIPGMDSGIVLTPKLSQSFRTALSARVSRLNRDVEEFNKPNGQGWNRQWNSWGSPSIDARNSNRRLRNDSPDDVMKLMDGLIRQSPDYFLTRLRDMEFEALGFEGRKESLVPIALAKRRPMSRFAQFQAGRPSLSLVVSGKRLPARSTLVAARQPLSTQPGMASVLAADLLDKRLAELNQKKLAGGLSENETAEFNAVKVAIQRADRVGANLESSHLFWGGQSWNYQPNVKTFSPPAIQAYPNYSWSFDLTRYAGGLYSTTTDIAHEVIEQFGQQQPKGEIDDEARTLINKARSNFKPIAVSLGEGDEVSTNGMSILPIALSICRIPIEIFCSFVMKSEPRSKQRLKNQDVQLRRFTKHSRGCEQCFLIASTEVWHWKVIHEYRT